MLKIATWNVRGLNNPLKQKEVLSFIQSHKLNFIGVVESKVRREFLAATAARCFPLHWSHVSNIDNVVGPSRILLAWNPLLVQVSIVFSSTQMIFAKVESVDRHAVFYASVVYAHNSYE